MPYGGLFPFKTDFTTPVIADIVVADYDSVKFTHVPDFLGPDIVRNRYRSILQNDLGLAEDFFDDGSTEYPILYYDEPSEVFTAQYFKINTFAKINALLSMFQLFAKRSVDRAKLMKTAFDVRLAFTDKLKIVAAGTKYEYNGTVFKQNYDLISGYPTGSADTYKNMIIDMVMAFLGLNINVSDYLTWIDFELLPTGAPTKFALSFTIDDADKMALAQQIAWLIDNGFCMNFYKYMYDMFDAILAY